MSTYVFFCGYGTWYYPEEDCDGMFFYVPFKLGYETGYFIMGEYNELEYKHLGKLPTSLYPCDDTNIKHCAFNRLIGNNSYADFFDKKEYVHFSIEDDKEYSLVVVDKVDIPKENQLSDYSQESDMNTMKALAIMAWMLSEKSSAYMIAGRPNAKTINDAIQPLVEMAFPEDPPKLKSFNKKISEALQLFDKD
jgi:hypothetical protein